MDQKSMDVGDECHRPSLIARYLLNRFLALLSPPTLLAFGIASINGSEGKKKSTCQGLAESHAAKSSFSAWPLSL